MWSSIIFLLIVLGFIALIKGGASPTRNSSHQSSRGKFGNSSSNNSSWSVGDAQIYHSTGSDDSHSSTAYGSHNSSYNNSNYDSSSTYDSGSNNCDSGSSSYDSGSTSYDSGSSSCDSGSSSCDSGSSNCD